MADNLFGRLRDTEQAVKDRTIDAILEPTILPRDVSFFREKRGPNHITKEDLVFSYIERYFTGKQVALRSEDMESQLRLNSIYNGVNKEPLKRVGYGVANSQNIPSDLQNALSGWENLYFLAGLWHEKSTKMKDKGKIMITEISLK